MRVPAAAMLEAPMRSTIPDRERWLALGLLLLAIAAGYLLLVHPWWTRPMLELEGRIEALQQRDLRARMALTQQPEVLERLQALQAQAAREPGFMEENSPERATAALVQHLETIVAQASPNNRSCAIVNRSPMTQAREPRFPRAVVGVRLRCGNAELASVLHALESGAPRLFVENLNVLAQQSFADASAPGQGLGLDVSFDLVGYVRPVPAGNADAD